MKKKGLCKSFIKTQCISNHQSHFSMNWRSDQVYDTYGYSRRGSRRRARPSSGLDEMRRLGLRPKRAPQ